MRLRVSSGFSCIWAWLGRIRVTRDTITLRRRSAVYETESEDTTP